MTAVLIVHGYMMAMATLGAWGSDRLTHEPEQALTSVLLKRVRSFFLAAKTDREGG
jgi:hypothetical protein